jgi:hypothetical protein
MATQPDVEHDLRNANSISWLYRDLARLHRSRGASDKAKVLHEKIRAIWRGWDQARPNNPFVLRQLAAVEADAGDGAVPSRGRRQLPAAGGAPRK